MHSTQQDRISGLLDVVGLGGPNRRDTVLRILTDLFILDGERQSPTEREMHEQLMLNMAAEAGMVMRRELAERLAPHPHPPGKLMRMLARDDIDVARPLLRHSTALDDATLSEIVNTTTPDHVYAIAERAVLGPRTCDAIIVNGDRSALIQICRNPLAALSSDSIKSLSKLAAQDPSIATALLARKDLRPELMIGLFWQADSERRRTVLAKLGEMEGGPGTWRQGIPPLKAPIRQADTAARKAVQEGLAAILVARRSDEFRAMFAQVLGIKPSLARRIMNDVGGEPFAVACRAIGFTLETFTTMVILYNPAVGQSVERVYGLGNLFNKIPDSVAWHLLEAWNLASKEEKPADAMPVMALREAIHDAFEKDAPTNDDKDGSKPRLPKAVGLFGNSAA